MTDPGVVLLVDAANVVGSRPDGWWRDRAGAAARLVERLHALPGSEVAGHRVRAVVVVLEGAARAGAAESADDAFVVRHAPGSGDDVLASMSAPDTVVVTADRELADRARGRGAQVLGPRALIEALG